MVAIRTLAVVAVVALSAIALCAMVGFAGEEIKLRITSPAEGDSVSERPFVEGTVSDPDAKVWVVIHPLEVSTYWVQPAVTVKESGKWKVKVYVGKGDQGKGEQFEIMAVANPKTALSEGEQLSGWPEAEAKSQVVEVTRT